MGGKDGKTAELCCDAYLWKHAGNTTLSLQFGLLSYKGRCGKRGTYTAYVCVVISPGETIVENDRGGLIRRSVGVNVRLTVAILPVHKYTLLECLLECIHSLPSSVTTYRQKIKYGYDHPPRELLCAFSSRCQTSAIEATHCVCPDGRLG